MNGKKSIAALFLSISMTGAVGYWSLRHIFNSEIAPEDIEHGDHFKGKVTKVADGDTFQVQGASYTYKVRFWGADAVEKRQTCEQGRKTVACGKMGRETLKEMIVGQEVACEARMKKKDYWKRITALCVATINGKEQDIAGLMVRMGWAYDEDKYSGGYYKRDEDAARKEKRGLWDMKVERPSRWRACNLIRPGGLERPADCKPKVH